MNTYDTAIRSLRDTHVALRREITAHERELRKIEKALNALGIDATTGRSTLSPAARTNGDGRRRYSGRPTLEERQRRNGILARYLAVRRVGESFTVLDFLNATGEPMLLRAPYRELLGHMAKRGEISRLERGRYRVPA